MQCQSRTSRDAETAKSTCSRPSRSVRFSVQLSWASLRCFTTCRSSASTFSLLPCSLSNRELASASSSFLVANFDWKESTSTWISGHSNRVLSHDLALWKLAPDIDKRAQAYHATSVVAKPIPWHVFAISGTPGNEGTIVHPVLHHDVAASHMTLPRAGPDSHSACILSESSHQKPER